MIATYTMGRWSAFISPTAELHVPLAPLDGDDEHMVTIICPDHPILKKQQMIGWNAEGMWKSAIEYVDERHADDCDEEDKKDEKR